MLRKSAMLAAASAVALVATPALSAGSVADQDARTGGQVLAQAQAPGAAQTTGTARIQSDDLLNQNIENAEGENIGSIESVILDQDGQVVAVIVGVGGFLGIGQRDVAIAWDDLEIREDGAVIRSAMTREQLEGLPEYTYPQADQRGTAFVDREYRDPRQARQQTEQRMGQQAAERTGDAANWVDAEQFRVSDLTGASVVNQAGEQIGQVDDVIVKNGETQLILDIGGFLGIGAHSVLLDRDQVQLQHEPDNRSELRIIVDMSEEQLRALPEFDSQTWERGRGAN